MSTDTTSYPSLRDKTVVVTGGASGIGAAMVSAFSAQGAAVGFLDRDVDAGAALVNRLTTGVDARVHFESADVTAHSALTAALAECRAALGPVDVLINNVANDTRHDPQEVSAEAWRAGLAVNLDPAFFAAQIVFPDMRRRGSGAIINMSSINALLGPANMPGYVAAKAGLIGLTKALARDYGTAGVRVNAISPGWIATARQLELWLTPEAEADWTAQMALKMRIEPEAVANLALFLAADDSAAITGQNFIIDGGRT